MKVYVVLEDFPYEGYGPPVAVFTNEAAALAFVTARTLHEYFEMEVLDECQNH